MIYLSDGRRIVGLMGESIEQTKARLQVFGWLDQKLSLAPWVEWPDLIAGVPTSVGLLPLATQGGIWNPRQLNYTLSIMNTKKGIYEDQRLSEEVFEYAYQGSSGIDGTNTKLRNACLDKVPFILLEQVEVGRFVPHYPVFAISDDPVRRVFTVSLSDSFSVSPTDQFNLKLDKTYKEQIARRRIHQPRFRARVLLAYKESCAICQLKRVELLDAAHIIPDSAEGGSASVSNGLSLCKIHHAAYDRNVMGISADYRVKVRPDLLDEIDGPMLKNGIQAMENVKIFTPTRNELKPNKDSLDARFQEFLGKVS